MSTSAIEFPLAHAPTKPPQVVPTEQQHGSSCMLGNNASTHTYQDAFGRSFTGHWVVKPGRFNPARRLASATSSAVNPAK